ncbi:hypothetical protein N7495_002610 [Penicillium taxi]|uniref:uncharacterized protein n=1 Tax=Penicillium taxi TaxID=168475 RepID=UPI0025459457|nr:uncharacterized protein N7495_002610 [Penicillium taxi]KAJ5902082.1 hypothetical protein N7495_002610 [Penicillium taxi]
MRVTAAAEKSIHAQTVPDDDDFTSSSGSSSESDSEKSSDDEEDNSKHEESLTNSTAKSSIPSVPARRKPVIRKMNTNKDLMSRLSAFLPEMKNANEELEKEIAAGRGKDLVLDDADDADGKEYIEMNLGLGVLEEKKKDDKTNFWSNVESDDEISTELKKKSELKPDSDVLDTLMGGIQSNGDKPSIEEVHQ